VLGLADPSTRQTLVALFRRATCFVLPSLYEPFGIVYVEAGRAGLPSIATSVGGAHDAVGPGGGEFVAPRSDVDLFEAMRTMANGATAAAAGACAARYSARLSWSLVAGRVAGALGEALPGGPVDDLVELDANWASSLSNEHHQ
jgi:glycosyltransferase involved in cell wall biosynthesis